jgi:hypothetical protein
VKKLVLSRYSNLAEPSSTTMGLDWVDLGRFGVIDKMVN